LKVREFSREDERRLCIAFDNPATGAVPEQAYERAVSLAASLAWHFSSQNAEVSFLLSGHSRTTDVHEFLTRLALIEPQGDPSPRTLVGEKLAGQARPHDILTDLAPTGGEYNIILTARPRESLPPALWDCAHLICIGEGLPAPMARK